MPLAQQWKESDSTAVDTLNIESQCRSRSKGKNQYPAVGHALLASVVSMPLSQQRKESYGDQEEILLLIVSMPLSQQRKESHKVQRITKS